MKSLESLESLDLNPLQNKLPFQVELRSCWIC